MVRVAAMRNAINSGLIGHIRRVYPAIQGPERWGNIIQNRTKYLKETFPLTQEPLIEAIPQYQPGKDAKPSSFHRWAKLDGSKLSDVDAKRLQGLSDILQIDDVTWDLYPHQSDAILAHLEDRDVVVATGTGSGKTESFLYPMITHLHDEAMRLKEDGEEKSERAVKTIILYPMNALVADQMSRLRKLLGNPKIASHFLNNGYGRFPQFGMYTGRTPFHGWFAKPKDGNPAKYERVNKTDRIGKIVKHYERLKDDTRVWDELVERYKIPAVGGKIDFADAGEEYTISFEYLPPWTQADLLKNKGSRSEEEIKSSNFTLTENLEVFKRFNLEDKPRAGKGDPKHLRFMGDCLDRELISRHQMHLGGVRQYIDSKWKDKTVDTSDVIDDLGVGIPDVMVTNYSMLEYMLMRPLEHVFWHETKKWLDGCTREKDDPLRRKLLLVVDEAHLYQGAMGTEFSLLLNRLLSVISGESEGLGRDRLQFIITSASLGNDMEEARNYSAGLLTLEGERKERMWIPDAVRLELEGFDGEERRIPDGTKKILAEGFLKLKSLPRNEVEELILEKLFDNYATIRSKVEKEKPESKYEDKLKHRVELHMQSWSPAHRLRRLLLRSETLHEVEGAKEALDEAVKYSGIPSDIKLTDNMPRRVKLLRHYMFESPTDKDCSNALDMLLDLIASARSIGSRKPFLPMRMHMFFRGDTVSRVCISCGEISSAGVGRCSKCNSANYELMIDRNCGGTFVKLWCDSAIKDSKIRDIKTPVLSDFGRITRVWQSRNIDPDSDRDSFMGVFAQVLNDDEHLDSQSDYYLNKSSGTMVPYNTPPKDSELHHYVKIRILVDQQKNGDGFAKHRWEQNGGFVEPRICPYCNESYTRTKTAQFSDTQTRGDQFFLEAIANATSNLDPIEDSPNAHKGRKMLLFSDGRQRAANLARDLKNAQATDQGRAMFIYLHKQKWFQKIPEQNRTLHRLYPYLCLFAGLARNNPLIDSAAKPERAKMISHTVLLISNSICKFKDDIPELKRYMDNLIPGNVDQVVQQFIKKRIIYSMKRITNRYLWEHGDTDQIRDKKKALTSGFKKARNEFKKVDRNWIDFVKHGFFGTFPNDLKESMSELGTLKNISEHPDFSYISLEIECKKLKKLVDKKEERLIPHVMRTQMLDNPKIKEFDICQDVSRILITNMEKDESLIPKFVQMAEDWVKEVLPYDTTPVPPLSIGSLILRWCCDKLFGLQSLGLGELTMLKNENSKFDSDEWEIISSGLPLLFSDLGGFAPQSAGTNENTKRSICSKNGSIGYGSIYESFASYPSRVVTFDDNDSSMKAAIRDGLCRIYRIQDNDVDKRMMMHEIAEKVVDEANSNGDSLLYKYEREGKFKLLLDADRVIMKPIDESYKFELEDGSKIDCPRYYCNSCLNPRPISQEEIPCPRCESIEIIDVEKADKIQRERALGYFEERLLPWHKIISNFDEDSTLAVYRAEEHTAQISTKKNEEDAHTLTEQYELMFQDVPIQSFELALGDRIEQPPIDILSSTTTMEVGIDLGDLNAVALRTVPPHASNYQQRVGRAGRGSSEVSMALTWIDNSAYAQSSFERPETLVSHPNEPPRLYLDNQKIRQRHVNALLFQRFFKRFNYVSETLSFDGMEASEGSLLESLGSVKNFVANLPKLYGIDDFLDYINQIKGEINSGNKSNEAMAIIHATGSTDDIIIEAIEDLLPKMELWKKLDFGDEEE